MGTEYIWAYLYTPYGVDACDKIIGRKYRFISRAHVFLDRNVPFPSPSLDEPYHIERTIQFSEAGAALVMDASRQVRERVSVISLPNLVRVLSLVRPPKPYWQ
jgi:hypothetical protein